MKNTSAFFSPKALKFSSKYFAHTKTYFDASFCVQETRNEAVRSPVNEKQAKVNRDSVAKYLYSKYFELLVNELNQRLAPPTPDNSDRIPSISLLDIYGFEVSYSF